MEGKNTFNPEEQAMLIWREHGPACPQRDPKTCNACRRVVDAIKSKIQAIWNNGFACGLGAGIR